MNLTSTVNLVFLRMSTFLALRQHFEIQYVLHVCRGVGEEGHVARCLHFRVEGLGLGFSGMADFGFRFRV